MKRYVLRRGRGSMRQECSVILTKTARAKMENDYEKAAQLFNKQSFYRVHIEREAAQASDELKVKLIMSPRENKALQGDVIVMHCLCKADGFLVVNYQTEPHRFHTHLETNYRLTLDVKFITESFRKGIFTKPFREAIEALPIAKERSAYVEKRIASWEGYLQIQESKETQNDIEASYQQAYFNDSFSKMTLQLAVKSKVFSQIENYGVSLAAHSDIGNVVKVNAKEKTVVIELRAKAQRLARQRQLLAGKPLVTFTNRASLIQLQRLRGGFKALADGLAVNPNLESVLFEKTPRLQPLKTLEPITFHNDLNDYQQRAVRGALASSDIFTIQGPPGTGKTTVIAEICLQNVRAGKRTLIASQSNLAVDNALGRLFKDVDTRILRFGRTESIEEEGRPFIEENVGYYWLEQTLAAVEQTIAKQPSESDKLQEQIHHLQQTKEALQREFEHHQKNIEQVAQAEERLPQLREQMVACKAMIDEADAKKEALIIKQQAQQQASLTLVNELEQLFEKHANMPKQLAEKYAQYKERYADIQQQLAYQQVVAQLQHYQHQRVDKLYDNAHYDEAARFIAALTTPERLARYFKRYGISVRHFPKGLAQTLRAYGQLYKYRQIQERIQQVITALAEEVDEATYVACRAEAIMKTANFSFEKIAQGLQAFTQREVGEASARWLLSFMTIGVYVHHQCKSYQYSEQQIQDNLAYIRTLLPQVLQQERFMNDFIVQTQQQKEAQRQVLEQRLQNFTCTPPSASVEQLTNELKQVEKQQLDVELEQMQQAKITARLEQLQQQIKQYEASIEQLQQEIETQLTISRQKNKEGSDLQKEALALKALIQTNPQQAYDDLIARQRALDEHYATLVAQQAQQPIIAELRETWRTLLQEATDEDSSKIREMYVAHANVVGTTCVASARPEFTNSFDAFDTVIIDEVSKATPPELLLPMLKGKQIILVGDHHQLPPLLGDDTLEETMAQMLLANPSLEGKKEIAQLLKESLFERLFKQLPATHKQMLAIQYRMHDQIMQSIAPFYADEAGGLQCGLQDSDSERDHGLTTTYFKRDNHLVWLDTPSTEAYYEQRVVNGTSRYNEGELATIKRVLIETNEAVAEAKQAGSIPLNEQKTVGVISFYGEQVKRLTRLVEQEVALPHLLIRTGTVDKFQGMEMDIVMVSMVRNAKKGGDVGFAKDYRRLNVALSRARQLLILVGNSEMFAEKARHSDTREMYTTLRATVEQVGGSYKVGAVGVK